MNVWQIETLQLFSLRQCSSINKVQWTLPLTQNWLRSIALCIYYWQRSESWLNFVVIFYPRKFGILYQDCSDLLLRKNCSSNRGKLLKFEAEGQEFSKFLRSTCSWRALISNTQNPNWKKLCGFRNMQEKLENILELWHDALTN